MNSSESFSSVDEDRTPAATREIQKFAQGLLKGLRFRGTFVEKRYVPAIKLYRSVIHINADEKPLIRILMEIKKRIDTLHGDNNPFFWIGFTQSNKQFFLWVNLAEEILGEYLFHIRAFEMDETEAKVRLRQVRLKETTPKPERTFNNIGSNFMDDTVKPIVKDFTSELGINMRSTLTFTNVKDASFFIIIAMVACVSGAFYTLKYLLEFFLRFTREFSLVVKSLTPTFLSIIDLVKYIVFGFYWVIIALFRPSQKVPTNHEFYNQQKSIQSFNNGPYAARRNTIQYRNPNRKMYGQRYQGITITELKD